MQIKLDSSDMEAAVLEYVAKRVQIPDGFKLDVSSGYISGLTVYMEPIEESEPAKEAEEPGTVPAGAD